MWRELKSEIEMLLIALLDLALGLAPPSRTPPSQCLTRRAVAGAAAAAILAPSLHPSPAHALIKGLSLIHIS